MESPVGEPTKDNRPAAESAAERKSMRLEAARAVLAREKLQAQRGPSRQIGSGRPAAPSAAEMMRDDQVVRLEEAVPGKEVEASGWGRAYVIETRVSRVAGYPAQLCREFASTLAATSSGLCGRLAARCGSAQYTPEDLVFVDLETTGLSCSPLFLIGAMVWEDGEFVVRQFLARHYGEEPAATCLFLDLAGPKKLLVTFNGKTFDIPYIRTRAAANTLPCRLDHNHFDLLHESRRVWGRTLPNCKLQTLERFLCGRMRYDDIPGHEIPEAYHAFVRTGNAAQMVQILKHNLLDLVTLAELMVQLPPLPQSEVG